MAARASDFFLPLVITPAQRDCSHVAGFEIFGLGMFGEIRRDKISQVDDVG